jgi:hypothetical protein
MDDQLLILLKVKTYYIIILDIISMITLHGIEILYGHRNIMNCDEQFNSNNKKVY